MKKLLVLMALIVVLIFLTGCNGTSDKHITTAKVRYFEMTKLDYS